MNPKSRTLVRIYLSLSAFSAVWLAWGMSKPMIDRDRAMKAALAAANKVRSDCESANSTVEADYEHRENIWVKRGGIEPISPPAPEDCIRPQFIALEGYRTLERETRAETYRRAGYLKIAVFCLLPPVLGYLLILACARFAPRLF